MTEEATRQSKKTSSDKLGLSFRLSGDLGDGVFQACVVKHFKGRHVIYCVNRPGITGEFIARVPLLKPLFESQDYIEAVICSEDEPDIDLVPFRRWHSSTTTLVQANAAEYSFITGEPTIISGEKPWIAVKPNKDFNGKVIIARSPRYQNKLFPWYQIVEHYGPRLVFVGLLEEHQSFCESYGHVPHLRVKDFLELAQAIAGASLFIGNQSSPHAVALAIGAPIISEVCAWQPDCVYKRTNVQYVCDGAVTLPDISDSGVKHLPATFDISKSFNTNLVPSGFWQYPGLPECPHFPLQVEFVEKLEKCPKHEAEAKLYDYNSKRVPEFFHGGSQGDPMSLFRIASANAFGEKLLSKTQ